jgi:hypothetical protein
MRGPLLALLIALAPGAPAQEAGLAARYPGDRGLADDPDVLLFEDFDAPDLEAVTRRWDSVSDRGKAVLALDPDAPGAASGAGRKSLRLTAHPGADDGGHLYRRLPREVDAAHLRFYVKFPEPANYIHHFVHFGGYRPATRYPQGGAGERPDGDERMTVGVEPFGQDGRLDPPGAWNLYTYWHEMRRSADGGYWGNAIVPAGRPRVPSGRWQCVEVRLAMNTPGRRDGELALWLDGQPVADVKRGTPRGPWTGLGFDVRDPTAPDAEPFEGFDFRKTADLKVNFVWLLHYVTATNQRRNRLDDPARPSVVLFDQVVAATRYIGPIAAE